MAESKRALRGTTSVLSARANAGKKRGATSVALICALAVLVIFGCRGDQTESRLEEARTGFERGLPEQPANESESYKLSDRPKASGVPAREPSSRLSAPSELRVSRPSAKKSNKPRPDEGAPFGVWVKAGEAKTVAFGDAELEIPAGAVDKDVRITVRPLSASSTPPMDRGLTNVTPGRGAYRFGPHGLHFKKPVRLSLPVDARLMPPGMTPSDVQTFYFDEGAGKWQRVARIASLDRGRVHAKTTHFTDFINATIAVPDHPQAQSFNPTSIKDMKLADPAAGVTLINPPGASQDGGASLSFPIEVPGRCRARRASVARAMGCRAPRIRLAARAAPWASGLARSA